MLGQKVADFVAGLRIQACADKTGGLVQRQIHFSLRLDKPAIHRHAIARGINFRAQLRGGLAIDGDPRPAVMICSLARREAIPASARSFWSRTTGRLRLAFGFAEAGDAVADFPLAAFFEDCDPLEPFHDIAFGAGGACRPQTSML
jgi:hypothetical protein